MTELLTSPQPELHQKTPRNTELRDGIYREGMDRLKESRETLPLPGSLSERIQYAQERSSFKQSPEVSEAIESYYTDHYALSGVIERVIQNDTEDLGDNTVDATVENHLINQTAKELLDASHDPTKRYDTLRLAENALYDVLYQERAVADETLDEPEVRDAHQLADTLRKKAVEEGFAEKIVHPNGAIEYRWIEPQDSLVSRTNRMRTPNQLDDSLNNRRKLFWEDARHAGQLEFHNTGNILDIEKSGAVLRSRTRQRQLTGSFKSQMGVQNNRTYGMHSNLPHFSETYSYHEYKRDVFGGDESHPGTYAVPLAKLIETAPYARDSKYAVVELNDPADMDKIVINDRVGDIGSQGDDMPGKHGEDRVFFADYRADHSDNAVNYDIALGDESFRILTEDEAYETYARTGFGTGEHTPGLMVVPMHKNKFINASPEERDRMYDAMAKEIKRVQESRRNMPKYRNKVVVPLRSGVMEFETEAQPKKRNHQVSVRNSVA